MQARVAVIDDQRGVRETLVDWLDAEASRRGDKMEFVSFENAGAFSRADDGALDVVVTDMVMETPKAGLDVCRQLRERSPVVIILTAYPDYALCVSAMRLRVWDYIPKTPDDTLSAYRAVYDSIAEAYEKRAGLILAQRENTDAAWAQQNLDALIGEFGGRIVAIVDRKVADSDADFEALAKRVRAKFPYTVVTFHCLPAVPGADQN